MCVLLTKEKYGVTFVLFSSKFVSFFKLSWFFWGPVKECQNFFRKKKIPLKQNFTLIRLTIGCNSWTELRCLVSKRQQGKEILNKTASSIVEFRNNNDGLLFKPLSHLQKSLFEVQDLIFFLSHHTLIWLDQVKQILSTWMCSRTSGTSWSIRNGGQSLCGGARSGKPPALLTPRPIKNPGLLYIKEIFRILSKWPTQRKNSFFLLLQLKPFWARY